MMQVFLLSLGVLSANSRISAAKYSMTAARYTGEPVMEYLAAEVLELAGTAARDNKKTHIIPCHLHLAIRNNEELNKLLSSVTIAQGGVIIMHFRMRLRRPPLRMPLLPRRLSVESW